MAWNWRWRKEGREAKSAPPLVALTDPGGPNWGGRDSGALTRDGYLRNAVASRLFGASADPVKIGRYTILTRLGAGAMGVVYAAYDTQLDRKIAVKLLRGVDEEGAHHARMTREAQALAKLSHNELNKLDELLDDDIKRAASEIRRMAEEQQAAREGVEVEGLVPFGEPEDEDDDDAFDWT